MYREGQSVFVQNQLLFLDQLSRPFEVTAIGEFVKPRNTVSEDGVKISEWNVSLDEIGAFCRDEKKK